MEQQAPSARPWLIALKGFPGSGKSTLGRLLAGRLRWPLIDKDDLKDLLDGRTPEAGLLSYLLMLNLARRQLTLGLSTICDSPLTYASIYRMAAGIAVETGANLAVLECFCSDEAAWRERIDGRGSLGLPAHHQTTWSSFETHRRRVLDETAYPITAPHLLLDTARPLPAVLDEALAWLETLGATTEYASAITPCLPPPPGASG